MSATRNRNSRPPSARWPSFIDFSGPGAPATWSFAGGEARLFSGQAADQARPRREPDRAEGAWSRRAADAARPRRRGDRMSYAPALPPTLLGSGMALLG